VFWGLGADGTVGANKNSIKIIGEETDNFAQGYFVYDSKKSGTYTNSHLRFGPRPIRSAYLIKRANFVAVHQWVFNEKYDVLAFAAPGATVLLNSPYPAEKVWDELPREMQEQVLERNLKLYTIDAIEVAHKTGMGGRINSIMQTCFFALAGILPREEAIAQIKKAIQKTYGRKGEDVVRRNWDAVDATLAHLHEMKIPGRSTARFNRPPVVSEHAPDFVQRVTATIMSARGDLLPVSAFPPDGTWPTGTTQWEKRNIALEIPVWDQPICIQCNKCAMVCPHAAIRVKVFPAELAAEAPKTFKYMDYKGSDFKGMKYSVQVAPEDCTGCQLCVEVCPGKDKANPKHRSLEMANQLPLRAQERDNYAFFLKLPEADRTKVGSDLKGTQFLQPLFEYSGACSGCGETPYIKLATQLFGDRMIVGNATGCSSIYGGNTPTTPYAKNADGRGPTWNNSLFEDCAEFSMGLRLSVDMNTALAKSLLRALAPQLGDALAGQILDADMGTEAGIAAQRARVADLRTKLAGVQRPEARRLETVADYLVRKSVWAIGGDGWAYDIGYGGLDHVIASGRDINLLVLDTEVYSNTGGQQSKSTPMGAAAKFAAAGKGTPKKDLGMLAMTYGNVYVARIAFGAKDVQTVNAFREADSFPGPSLIIAYSHCINHGYDMEHGLEQQKIAVETGYWPLFRYDPRRAAKGESPLKIDSGAPKGKVLDFARGETRFRMVEAANPERFRTLMETAQADAERRFALYEQMAKAMAPQAKK